MIPTTVMLMHSALITLAVSPVHVTQATKAMAQTVAILMNARALIVVPVAHVRMQSVKYTRVHIAVLAQMDMPVAARIQPVKQWRVKSISP